MSHHAAAAYRQRASRLRNLAHQMTSTSAMSVHNHAGASTWHGPRADACLHALTSAQHGIYRATDDLLDTSWRFDRIADELEAAALRAERELAD